MANPVLNQIFVSSPYRPRHHCELCWKLNFPSEFSKSYKNLTDWWLHDDKRNFVCDV